MPYKLYTERINTFGLNSQFIKYYLTIRFTKNAVNKRIKLFNANALLALKMVLKTNLFI